MSKFVHPLLLTESIKTGAVALTCVDSASVRVSPNVGRRVQNLEDLRRLLVERLGDSNNCFATPKIFLGVSQGRCISYTLLFPVRKPLNFFGKRVIWECSLHGHCRLTRQRREPLREGEEEWISLN